MRDGSWLRVRVGVVVLAAVAALSWIGSCGGTGGAPAQTESRSAASVPLAAQRAERPEAEPPAPAAPRPARLRPDRLRVTVPGGPGARVRFLSDSPDGSEVLATETTDEHGRAGFDLPGLVHVLVEQGDRVGLAVGVDVLPAGTQQVTVALRASRRVAGVVVDEHGDPVSEGRVLLCVPNEAGGGHDFGAPEVVGRDGEHVTAASLRLVAPVGADGRFEFPPVPAEPRTSVPHAVLADVPGRAQRFVWFAPDEEGAGSLRIEAPRAVRVRASLSGAETHGRPVFAHVDRAAPRVIDVRSDGRVALDDVGVGSEIVFCVGPEPVSPPGEERTGAASRTLVVPLDARGGHDFGDVRLDPPVELAGTVETADGVPMGGEHLFADCEGRYGDCWTKTDAEGRFALVAWPHQPVEVRCWIEEPPAGHLSPWRWFRAGGSATARPGESARVVVRPIPLLVLRAVDPDGRPAEFPTARIVRLGRWKYQDVRYDVVDGRVVVPLTGAAPLTLRFGADGYRPMTVAVDSLAPRVERTLVFVPESR